jgi:FkbM family methyltransferase
MNRGHAPRALRDYLDWQYRSRQTSDPIAVPFVNDAVLMARHGMHGATQNIYCGLADFDDMGFLLHLLRPGDLFVDVGANVGTYTVLASAAIGADTIAFEPNPETFPDLQRNIEANRIASRVQAVPAGAGAKPAVLKFRASGTQTRVATGDTGEDALFESPIVTLDEVLKDRTPTLIKIDVEGFESDVLTGAQQVLQQPELLALILEVNDHAQQFGDPNHAHNILISRGFVPANYAPRERRLGLRTGSEAATQNYIYIRSQPAIEGRLKSAPPFRVKNQSI